MNSNAAAYGQQNRTALRYKALQWLGGAALVLTLAAPSVQARELAWSIGLSSPGVSMGFGNAMPVVVAPAMPMAVAPPVVVYPPAVMAPPVYGVAWAPPAPVYARPWYGHGHHHGHDRYRGWEDDGYRSREGYPGPGHHWR